VELVQSDLKLFATEARLRVTQRMANFYF